MEYLSQTSDSDGAQITSDVVNAETKLIDVTGCKATKVFSHGASAWARSFKIEAQSQSGEPIYYFMKVRLSTPSEQIRERGETIWWSAIGDANAGSFQVSIGEHGKRALEGEYLATKAIQEIVPGFVPTPVDNGSLTSIPNNHYYLCRFHDLAEELPEPEDFCAKVAALHQNSASETGQFGFETVTYNGDLPQRNDWAEKWEEFFADGIKHMLTLNTERGGQWPEMEALKSEMLSKVIPRLLRPLETGGRFVKPSLVHGDLWCGNAAVDMQSDLPIVYDPSAFFAHNEYELGNWRPERNKFSQSYFNCYHSHIPKAYPEEDHDDRNALYSMRFNLQAAALFPEVSSYRSMVIDEVRRLVEKFPGGFEEWANSHPE